MTTHPGSGFESCVYRGRVAHARFTPKRHAFRYRMFVLYLDLDELDRAFAGRWLWSVGRANVASWRREDFLGSEQTPLKQAVLDRAEAELGRRPGGPVRMLAHLRYFGLGFNPVTFYYCFAPDGRTLECIVAEITNTPWNERHAYVLDARQGEAGGVAGLRWEFDKDFHVSPFLDMDYRYSWRFGLPGEELIVHMENHRDGELHFCADLRLQRREITGGALARALASHPFMSGKVVLAIYWQALRLWWKRVPSYTHPKRAAESAA